MSSGAINWSTRWHGAGPAMNGNGSVTFTRNSERDRTVYFSGYASNSRVYSSGKYPYNVVAYISINGNIVQSINVTNGSYAGTGYFSGSFSWDSNGTVSVHYVCGQPGGCTRGYPDVTVGSMSMSALPYNPEVPPTNVTGGKIYNQSGVQNGDEKPDRNFSATWSGYSAGTHSITQFNLDLYRSTDLNTIVSTVSRASKNTQYNFQSLMPKCKVGETYVVYVNMLVDGNRWMGRVRLGQIKLYKDGIVYFKDSSGNKREATMAYNKNINNGAKNTSRYILVKDINGNKRILDMYTTHYE